MTEIKVLNRAYRYRKVGAPLAADDPIKKHEANIRGDMAFCAAMSAAIERGEEHAPVGIDTRPCTEYPVFVRLDPPVSLGSPAQMCAEASGVRYEKFI